MEKKGRISNPARGEKIIARSKKTLKMDKEKLLQNLDKIHTTKLGVERIQNNLSIKEDVVAYCKNKIKNKNCKITHSGKNWYCEVDSICFTINSSSYTIITAHLIK